MILRKDTPEFANKTQEGTLLAMFEYNRNTPNFASRSVTGGPPSELSFVPEQPSTWPPSPSHYDDAFQSVLTKIFRETMLDELRNVIQDVLDANGSKPLPLVHRGHVIAVAYMCALDAISAYGYKDRKRVAKFIKNHFPEDYKRHADRIYPEYRISLVHEWNLFGDAALLPGNEPIQERNGQIEFGLLNFRDAFESATNAFIDSLAVSDVLQRRALNRYREVIGEAERTTTRAGENGTLVVLGAAVGIVVTGLLGIASSTGE